MATTPSQELELNEQSGTKRPFDTAFQGSESSISATSSFRNVSACNRCRVRKLRCDQQLPRCSTCERANVRCVGYDPITKREIPRSYVYFLETRVEWLESLLQKNDIDATPLEDFFGHDHRRETSERKKQSKRDTYGIQQVLDNIANVEINQEPLTSEKSNTAPSVGMDEAENSTAWSLNSTSGISFARVVLSAVKAAKPSSPPPQSAQNLSSNTAPPMRDGFFGLAPQPSVEQALFPGKEVGLRLVKIYFEHINATLPILHRTEFMDMFHRVYAIDERSRTSQELYLLNIVFASAAAVLLTTGPDSDEHGGKHEHKEINVKPENYHAAAISHFHISMATNERNNGLEELKAVLLLAAHALLRPISPGLWYIVGVAVRLALDIGLHCTEQDASHPLSSRDLSKTASTKNAHSFIDLEHSSTSRQTSEDSLWTRDLQSRLWWCVYSLDKQASFLVDRPFGIPEYVITTELPSFIDDEYITPTGLSDPAGAYQRSPFRELFLHLLQMKILQSELAQVFHCRRLGDVNQQNRNKSKPSFDFIYNFANLPTSGPFHGWTRSFESRLKHWLDSTPALRTENIKYSRLNFELEYWQTRLVLCRHLVQAPVSTSLESSGTHYPVPCVFPVLGSYRSEQYQVSDAGSDFFKLVEAAQKVLELYGQLHRMRLVYHPHMATHHMFMAGISFLFALWHSASVRRSITLKDFDLTVLAATSVLSDLAVHCPAAEACRAALERMSKETIQIMVVGDDSVDEQKLDEGESSRKSEVPTSKPSAQSAAQTLNDSPQAQSYSRPPSKGLLGTLIEDDQAAEEFVATGSLL